MGLNSVKYSQIKIQNHTNIFKSLDFTKLTRLTKLQDILKMLEELRRQDFRRTAGLAPLRLRRLTKTGEG